MEILLIIIIRMILLFRLQTWPRPWNWVCEIDALNIHQTWDSWKNRTIVIRFIEAAEERFLSVKIACCQQYWKKIHLFEFLWRRKEEQTIEFMSQRFSFHSIEKKIEFVQLISWLKQVQMWNNFELKMRFDDEKCKKEMVCKFH